MFDRKHPSVLSVTVACASWPATRPFPGAAIRCRGPLGHRSNRLGRRGVCETEPLSRCDSPYRSTLSQEQRQHLSSSASGPGPGFWNPPFWNMDDACIQLILEGKFASFPEIRPGTSQGQGQGQGQGGSGAEPATERRRPRSNRDIDPAAQHHTGLRPAS